MKAELMMEIIKELPNLPEIKLAQVLGICQGINAYETSKGCDP